MDLERNDDNTKTTLSQDDRKWGKVQRNEEELIIEKKINY